MPHRDPTKEKQWRDHLHRCESSGCTIREYCDHQGLSECSFYYWCREIARRDQDENFIANNRFTFAEIQLNDGSLPADAIEVTLSSGHRVRLGSAFQRETLIRALEVLLEHGEC